VRLTAVTWLLDVLDGRLSGSLAGALKSHDGLSLTDAWRNVSRAWQPKAARLNRSGETRLPKALPTCTGELI
jgi:hypothetical protein